MPRSKRTPIDYKPQYSDSMFRPKEVVDSEIESVDLPDDSSTVEASVNSSLQATHERTNERTNERPKVRHSFDVYKDQLLHLTDIQADVFRRTGRKPKVGDLVQEALDTYIDTHLQTTTERRNVRTNDRTG